MSCVNVSSKEFKSTCSRLDINSGQLETIVHEYINTEGNENSFPSDDYIISKVSGKPVTSYTDAIKEIREKNYSKPIKLNSYQEAVDAVNEARRYFKQENIGLKITQDGKYELIVGEIGDKKNELIHRNSQKTDSVSVLFNESYGKNFPYNNRKFASVSTLGRIREIIQERKYKNPGTDIIVVDNYLYIVDHSDHNKFLENINTGDGFGVRYKIKIDEIKSSDTVNKIAKSSIDFIGKQEEFKRLLIQAGVKENVITDSSIKVLYNAEVALSENNVKEITGTTSLSEYINIFDNTVREYLANNSNGPKSARATYLTMMSNFFKSLNIDGLEDVKIIFYNGTNTETNGFIVTDSGNIWLRNPIEFFSSEEAAFDVTTPTLIHELVHSLTLSAYNNNKKFKAEVQNIYKSSIDFLKKQGRWNEVKGEYGFKSDLEFIAEAMSNFSFAAILKTIDSVHPEKKSSIFQDFIDAITEVLQKFFKGNKQEIRSILADCFDLFVGNNEILKSGELQNGTTQLTLQNQNKGQNIEQSKENAFEKNQNETNQQIRNLRESGMFTQGDIRDIAQQVVWFAGDEITRFLSNPEDLIDAFPELVEDGGRNFTDEERKQFEDKIRKMSRHQLINFIGATKFLEYVRDSLFKTDLTDEDRISTNPYIINNFVKMAKANLIYDNFKAILQQAQRYFLRNEKISLSFNEIGKVEASEAKDALDVQQEGQEDNDSKRDNGEDMQEAWQVLIKTIDAFDQMSEAVRAELSNLHSILPIESFNPDGSVNWDEVDEEYTDYGVIKRIDPIDATKSILRWTQGSLSLSKMIQRLQEKEKEHPWLHQLIVKLSDTTGQYSQFQQEFFSVMQKHGNVYCIVQKKDGKFTTQVINELPALKEAVNTVRNLVQINQHPLFQNGTVNEKSFNSLKDCLKELTELKDKDFKDIDKEALIANIGLAANILGYYVSAEIVASAINGDNFKKAISALEKVVSDIEEGAKTINYDPFNFGTRDNPSPGYIGGHLRLFFSPITEVLEDTAQTSFYDNGNMYQTYTAPSFLSKLVLKMHGNQEEFEQFITDEYGKYEFFCKNPNDFYKASNWNTPWLAELVMAKPELRKELFKHKVQLNFDKSQYMRGMTQSEYALSILTEFFGNKKQVDGRQLAWYRIPMMSNKPSNEFIQFIRYTGPKYKDTIKRGMYKMVLQEIQRIQSVLKRDYKKSDPKYIENFDKNGKKFIMFEFLEDFHTGPKKDTELGKLLNDKIAGKEIDDDKFAKLVQQEIENNLNEVTARTLRKWKQNGIFDTSKQIEGMEEMSDEQREQEIENFVWNDKFAAMNFLELTITDLAFYKDTEDVQKRLAQLHAPGLRGNPEAIDFDGNRVSDGNFRTIYIKDEKEFVSNIIENLKIVFDRKIKEAPKDEKQQWRELRDTVLKQYREIDIADGQAYNGITSYRKKAITFGRWGTNEQAAYDRIRSGNFNIHDLGVAFQPLKPFVYSKVDKDLRPDGVDENGEPSKIDLPLSHMPVPMQNKNSEYLLLMAGALLAGSNTGKPNILKVLENVMEDTANDNPTKGIDTIQFNTAVKSGITGVIDLNKFIGRKGAETLMYNEIIKSIYNEDGSYNLDFVHVIPIEDYSLQQNIPQHFFEHKQLMGSQFRYIITSDLPDYDENGDLVTFDVIEDGEVKKYTSKEIKREFEETVASGIRKSINDLTKELHLEGSRKDKNAALSRILQEEIMSSDRYGVDLLEACSLDENGEFKIPLSDPIQSKRIEQLINSIIKNKINKQKIAGGPLVQVSNYGTSKQLKIVFKDKNGNDIKVSRDDFKSDKEYRDFLNENQNGISHYEAYAPAWMKELFSDFMDANGNVDFETVEKVAPEMLEMIGYRIPTEDKYSMAPLKIVGFLPEGAGDGIMLPYEITLITGSDFDVDKFYVMYKDLMIHRKDKADIREHLYNYIIEKYKDEHNGEKPPYSLKKSIGEEIEAFLDNPYTMKNASRNTSLLYNEYVKFAFNKNGAPDEDAARNNHLIDLSLAILRHKTTADQILRPGGFDTVKTAGYLSEAIRSTDYDLNELQLLSEGKMMLKDDKIVELNNDDIEKELATTGINALKEIIAQRRNICDIDTHLQYYKQNAAASTILGIFAVQKIAHAALVGDNFFINIDDEFILCDRAYVGAILTDMAKDVNGQFIGVALGSLVGASADAVKDPVLNYINTNETTAKYLTTMLRVGIPQNEAELLLASDAVSSLLIQHEHNSIDGYSNFEELVRNRVMELEEELQISPENEINKESLTYFELLKGIRPTTITPEIEYKTLKTLAIIMDINKSVDALTAPTRFNSIANAVGPQVIDNLILETKMDPDFSHIGRYAENGDELFDEVDVETIYSLHPILDTFRNTPYIANEVFGQESIPNSGGFRSVLAKMPSGMRSTFMKDRKLLSQLSDFYQSYLLIASDAIDPRSNKGLKYYIEQFPNDYFAKLENNPELQDNKLIQKIHLDVSTNRRSKKKESSLRVDITGLDQNTKDDLSAAWLDLYEKDKTLALDLFYYNFYRGGLAFSPKTFMSLLPLGMREYINGYLSTFRTYPHVDEALVIDQFIRNNADNFKLAPLTEAFDASKTEEGVKYEMPLDPKLYKAGYFKVKVKYGSKLYKILALSEDGQTMYFEEVKPLGGNGKFFEAYNHESINLFEEKAVEDSGKKESTLGEVQSKDSEEDNDVLDRNIDILHKILSPKAMEKQKAKSEKEKQDQKDLYRNWFKKKFAEYGVTLSDKEFNDVYENFCN